MVTKQMQSLTSWHASSNREFSNHAAITPQSTEDTMYEHLSPDARVNRPDNWLATWYQAETEPSAVFARIALRAYAKGNVELFSAMADLAGASQRALPGVR